MTASRPPRDLLTLRAVDGRTVRVQARMIRAVQPSETGVRHARVELYKKGQCYVVLADPAELAARVTALRPKARRAKPDGAPRVYEYSLVYHTRYRDPPDGMDRVQLRVRVEAAPGQGGPPTPPEILSRWQELGGPGCGWVICSQYVEPPSTVRSQEHRARQRLGNLQRRMAKKAPLFAEQLVADQLTRRPGYFAGESVEWAPAPIRSSSGPSPCGDVPGHERHLLERKPMPHHPNDVGRELGLLPTGRRLPLTPGLAFTKTETHGSESGAERCAGVLHTPAGDHPVLWDDVPDQDGDATITLYDHTLLLSSFQGEWTRHHRLLVGQETA